MKKREQKKVIVKKAQTAIEYMLLLTICALIVFASFKTFFAPEGRVRNGLDLYFNKVSNEVMGSEPEFTTIATTGGPCGADCTSFTYNDCPTADGCCWKYIQYAWYQPTNDPSIGAGQCQSSSSGCMLPGGSCEVFNAGVCCNQDSTCASMGGGCS